VKQKRFSVEWPFGRNAWMPIGSHHGRRRSISWRLGAGSTTRHVLTGRSGSGHRTNLPMRSRLAAISLDHKQPKTHLDSGTKTSGRSNLETFSLAVVQEHGLVNFGDDALRKSLKFERIGRAVGWRTMADHLCDAFSTTTRSPGAERMRRASEFRTQPDSQQDVTAIDRLHRRVPQHSGSASPHL
jgi:hypothetical protein